MQVLTCWMKRLICIDLQFLLWKQEAIQLIIVCHRNRILSISVRIMKLLVIIAFFSLLTKNWDFQTNLGTEILMGCGNWIREFPEEPTSRALKRARLIALVFSENLSYRWKQVTNISAEAGNWYNLLCKFI